MEKVKVTFTLSKDTKTLLKVYAAQTEQSVSDVIGKAIELYLERYPVK